MSKIIKASRITGEYRLEDKEVVIKNPTDIADLQKGISDPKVDSKDDSVAIEKARAKTEQLLKEAEQAAQEMKETAAEQVEEIKKEAYQQGYEDGFQKGEMEGQSQTRSQLQEVMASLENVILQVKNKLDRDIDNLQGDLIKLAISIAARIINTEIELKPQIINNIITDILNSMSHLQEIKIRVNSEMLKYIVEEEFNNDFVQNRIAFIADNTLKIGDCIVETNMGGRDGTIENKLELLEKELLKGAIFYET